MKNKVSIITWMMIAFATISFNASALGYSKSSPVEKQLRKQIKFPSDWNDYVNEAIVYASFTVSADGKVSVIEVNGTDESMRMHVIHQLEKMKIDIGNAEAGKIYAVKFNFKLIN